MEESPKPKKQWFDIEVFKRNASKLVSHVRDQVMEYLSTQKKFLLSFANSKVIAENNLKLGKHHFYQGNLTDAIMRFKGVIFLQPENAEAFYFLGRCYLAKEEEAMAIRQFESALKFDKQYTQAQYFLSKLQFPERVRRINPVFIQETFGYFVKDYNLIMQQLGYRGHEFARSLLQNHYKEEDDGKSIKSLLDIGCIGGGAARVFREKFQLEKVVGIDLCPEAVAALEREMFQDELLYSSLKAGDAEEIVPTYTEAFGIVLALRVFQYFGSLDHLLVSIAQSLCNGGYFIGAIYPAAEKRWELNVAKDRFHHLPSYVKEEAKRYGLEWLETRKVQVLEGDEDSEMELFICRKKSMQVADVAKK